MDWKPSIFSASLRMLVFFVSMSNADHVFDNLRGLPQPVIVIPFPFPPRSTHLHPDEISRFTLTDIVRASILVIPGSASNLAIFEK
jgi:hypothetical protein